MRKGLVRESQSTDRAGRRVGKVGVKGLKVGF